MALKSGLFALSIGVGTVTMKKSAEPSPALLLVKISAGSLRRDASTSPVRSCPGCNSLTRPASMSKPMTGLPARANAAATGKLT